MTRPDQLGGRRDSLRVANRAASDILSLWRRPACLATDGRQDCGVRSMFSGARTTAPAARTRSCPRPLLDPVLSEVNNAPVPYYSSLESMHHVPFASLGCWLGVHCAGGLPRGGSIDLPHGLWFDGDSLRTDAGRLSVSAAVRSDVAWLWRSGLAGNFWWNLRGAPFTRVLVVLRLPAFRVLGHTDLRQRPDHLRLHGSRPVHLWVGATDSSRIVHAEHRASGRERATAGSNRCPDSGSRGWTRARPAAGFKN